ncbi:Catsper1 [Symbiodinium natans]|uniref:Catsper1 protein n=1 Tax=Symbiodinium natans TaxID=878477 RepID=A0A812JJ62_9DINO|nr:Catsper1 [Symbiodinium natans]
MLWICESPGRHHSGVAWQASSVSRYRDPAHNRRLNFLGQHCAEELIERSHSEVRQEQALVESAQRQLVIIEWDEKRRTTFPGLLPPEPKKPLRPAPWEQPKPRRSSTETQAAPPMETIEEPFEDPDALDPGEAPEQPKPAPRSPERRASTEPT